MRVFLTAAIADKLVAPAPFFLLEHHHELAGRADGEI